jgi:hypothetical protein
MMNHIWVKYFFVNLRAGSDANVAFLFLLMRMDGYAFALVLRTLPSVNDVRICHLCKIIIMGAYLG